MKVDLNYNHGIRQYSGSVWAQYRTIFPNLPWPESFLSVKDSREQCIFHDNKQIMIGIVSREEANHFVENYFTALIRKHKLSQI